MSDQDQKSRDKLFRYDRVDLNKSKPFDETKSARLPWLPACYQKIINNPPFGDLYNLNYLQTSKLEHEEQDELSRSRRDLPSRPGQVIGRQG